MNSTTETGTIVRFAALHAFGALCYILGVALIVTNSPNIEHTIPAFVAASMFLLLFVTSAAIMGMIVFARPIIWFLNGEKVAAVKLAIATVSMLAIIAMIFLIAVTLLHR